MKHPLRRILRLRSLLEEISRAHLEAQLQELARMESRIEQLERSSRSMRQQRHEDMMCGASWQEAHFLGEWLAEEKFALAAAHEQKRIAAEVSKAEYLERRKERGQIESVMEAHAAVRAIERSRREQQELDDWFGQRSQKGRSA